jgi:plastocyanin
MRVRHAAVVVWTVALGVSIALIAMPLLAIAATASVSIQNFTFTPASLAIRAGDTVTWTNRDDTSHSARFSGMSTAVLAQGQSGSLTFNSVGTFSYVCGVHGASMKGTVIVEAVATPAPTPPPPTPPPPTPAPTLRTAPPTVRPAPPTQAPPPAAVEQAMPEPTPTPTLSLQPTPTPSLTPSATPAPVAVNAASPATTAGAAVSNETPASLVMLAGAVATIAALGTLAWVVARRT